MIRPIHTHYGQLDCIVVDGGPSPSVAAVICHGYGAPGHDLAGLCQPWINGLGEDAERFRFVFPAAPLTLAELGMPDGRAWWPLNMARMMEAINANKFDELHAHEPPGIVDARDKLCEVIDLVKEELGGKKTPLALGGFSQGAMLTMDTALRGTIDPPNLLIQFSGTVVCQSQWQAAVDRLKNTPVYQSHGTADPILPFSSAIRLQELLSEGGVEVQFHAFDGPHTIDGESIDHTTEAMRKL
ncbi:MAG: dienelactone hydrolase family protein [Pirellulaceae bacterium]